MDTLKNNFCPVCGYNLSFAPWVDDSPSDEICPCCAIQFGFDDVAGGDINNRDLIYYEWKKRWIANKMSWNSIGMPPPDNWDPIKQLKNSN